MSTEWKQKRREKILDQVRRESTRKVLDICLRNLNSNETFYTRKNTGTTHRIFLQGSLFMTLKEPDGRMLLNPYYKVPETHKLDLKYLTYMLSEIGYTVETSPA